MLLQQYLEESAKRYPTKIAVRFREESITYEQLDVWSNQVAHSLLLKGITPGSHVGLYVPKSIGAVSALFGILKAGSAYVPLDSDAPLERVSFMVSNCQINAIVVNDINIQRIAKNTDLFPEQWTVVNVSEKKPELTELPLNWNLVNPVEIKKQPAHIPVVESVDENKPAYILYTSGSTGKPKGVILSHMNGAVFIDWAAEHINLNGDNVFSSHAPFHFDLSIFDLYVSIKTGGTLCLIPPGLSYFADAVLDFIHENKITVWYSVPSALIQLLSYKDQLSEKLGSITTLIYAGEVFQYSMLNQLRQYLPSCIIHNWYGPTETNVITYYKIDAHQTLNENVPIGAPCPYANISIVDDHGRPVRKGEIGELVVNGKSLMKGYKSDPRKTNLSIKSLDKNKPKELFYFTGDLAYQRPDGAIVYSNRRDNMVKTRGFRVELGEVETALDKHPSVRKSLVLAVPDERITNKLVSYVTLAEDEKPDEAQLIDYCSEVLPAYMIPQKIYFLEEFPLTSTGKIDRIKLQQEQETIRVVKK